MIPNAIIVLSAGSVADKDSRTGETIYRSTTYAEGDAFGTLGGTGRVQAAALLAKKYPHAFVITTGKEGPGGVSHVNIQAAELETLGVSRKRIVLEEVSVNTKTQIEESLRIAEKRKWKRVLFVTNKYQVERVQAFVEHLQEQPSSEIGYQDAESVLSEDSPEFATEFARIVKSEPYQRRLAAEARGVEALKNGTYRAAPMEDKKERPV